MTSPSPSDNLEPALTAAEAELIDRLEEACSLEPDEPGAEDTGELLRLEDALRAATQAAERAVALRRQRKAMLADDVSCGVREFRDRNGREWRLWAVSPIARQGRSSSLEPLRPEYQGGWLTFETVDESERRRLPSYPEDWATRDIEGLEALLAQATPVAARRRRDPGEEKRAD